MALLTFAHGPMTSLSRQEWAIDLACDVLASGWRIRVLSVLDAFTLADSLWKSPGDL